MRAGKAASGFPEPGKAEIIRRASDTSLCTAVSCRESKAMKPLNISGKSQAVRSVKTLRCKRAKCKHLCRCQPGNVIIQTSAGTGAARGVRAVSWCQTLGRRAALLLLEWWLTQGGASPGIPECLPQPCQPESQERVPAMAGWLRAGHSRGWGTALMVSLLGSQELSWQGEL